MKISFDWAVSWIHRVFGGPISADAQRELRIMAKTR